MQQSESDTLKGQEHDSDVEDEADHLTPLSPQETHHDEHDFDGDERRALRPKYDF